MYLCSVGLCQREVGFVWVVDVKLWGSLQVQLIFVMIGKVRDDGVSCQITTLKASLLLKDCQCQHTNSIKVITVENERQYEIPQVTTSLSEQSFNVVTKTTEVRYLDKKYIIQDRYVFDYKPQSLEQQEQSNSPFSSFHQQPKSDDFSLNKQIKEEINKEKKVCIFQKRLKNGKPLLKRNTKNLPKNFYKGFLSFIEDHQFKQSSQQIIKQLKMLGQGIKYNNILIQKLLSNATIAPYFKQFLQNHAEDWINKSKINDKSIHIEAIPIYLSLFNKLGYAEGDQYWSDE